MIIAGCDYHPGFQQIAFVDCETGDCGERRLEHRDAAEKFYPELAAEGATLRVGMEASGHARWFERHLAELNFELWIGDATERAAFFSLTLTQSRLSFVNGRASMSVRQKFSPLCKNFR